MVLAFKSISIAATCGLVSTVQADAGGLTFGSGPATAPAAATVAADASWSGPYLGFGLGALRGESAAERGEFRGDLIELDVANGLFPDDIDDDDTGLAASLLGGYQVQRGRLVGGVELDLTAPGQDVEASFSRVDPGPVFPGVNTNTKYGTDIDALATLRLRGGYAVGRTLLFATGGLAAGRVENSFSLALPEIGYDSPDWREEETLFGHVVGLGVERLMGERLSLRAELMHYDLEDVTVRGEDEATFPGNALDYEFDNSGQIFRVSLNFRF